MSKGYSHLFPRKSINGQRLINEVLSYTDKISPQKVVLITKKDGKIFWLEQGNEVSGLMHILIRHSNQFIKNGIKKKEIANLILETLYQNKFITYQNPKHITPRQIYKVRYKGIEHYVAISVSDKGYVVGANITDRKGVEKWLKKSNSMKNI